MEYSAPFKEYAVLLLVQSGFADCFCSVIFPKANGSFEYISTAISEYEPGFVQSAWYTFWSNPNPSGASISFM